MVDIVQHIGIIILIATQVCSQLRGIGKSSCSLDTAPVWVDKGCAGEAVLDFRLK